MAERWNFTRVGSLHVVLLGGLLSVTLSAPNLAQASTRALQDQTDPSGISPHQLHLLYVVPKNGVDRSLDTNGVIAASAELAVAWLKGQNVAHRTIRLDRFGPSRQPDITFVQLDRDEESVYQHPNPLGSIEWELSIRGLLNEEKIYAAYYEGRFDPCAAAVQPPNIGRLALLAIGDERCRVGLLKPPLSRAGEWELTLVHETFHLLGAVEHGA